MGKITNIKEGEVLGEINKSGGKQDFKDWNATMLGVDVSIYEVEGRINV